jgi:hypothetical protein
MRSFTFLLPWRSQPRPEARQALRERSADKRHAHRVMASTPVFVYGRLENRGEPFAENTKTINVSARGGLVPISARVFPAQKLIVTNLQTGQDLLCRVARVQRAKGGQTFIGLEFLEPSPLFWCIEFGPAPTS